MSEETLYRWYLASAATFHTCSMIGTLLGLSLLCVLCVGAVAVGGVLQVVMQAIDEFIREVRG